MDIERKVITQIIRTFSHFLTRPLMYAFTPTEGWICQFVHRGASPNNTLRPRQDGRYFADDIFTCIFSNENCCILLKFSLKYVRKGPIDNNPALVQIMAWRRSCDKPLSEPMMVSLLTHICVARPQWDKASSMINNITRDVNKFPIKYIFKQELNKICDKSGMEFMMTGTNESLNDSWT